MDDERRTDGLMLVSLYHFVVGLMSVFVLCAAGAVLFPTSFLLLAGGEQGAEIATPILALVGMGLGAVLLPLAVANIVVGVGLWQRREWARLAAIALAIVRLLNVPLGTLIGGLIIWYLLLPEVKDEFAARRPAAGHLAA